MLEVFCCLRFPSVKSDKEKAASSRVLATGSLERPLLETRKEARALGRVPSCSIVQRFVPRIRSKRLLQKAMVVAGC